MISYRSRSGFAHEENQSPDLTSMLDVIFILLIFFILTANSVQHAFEMQLPDKGSDQAEAVDLLVLTLGIYSDQRGWRINDKDYADWAGFKQALLLAYRHHPSSNVIIAGDKEVPLEKLLQTVTFLKQQGIETAHILMEKQAR